MTRQENPAISSFRLTGIVFTSKDEIDGLLLEVANELELSGLKLAGVLQSSQPPTQERERSVTLRGLGSDWEMPVLQKRGVHARGCRLDSQAITDIAGRLLSDLQEKPDLLIINRFGRAESEGYGLRQVLEQAVSAEIPVLIGVREDYRDPWEQFHGGFGSALPPDLNSVLAWCKYQCG